jgi:hypothetical protein
MGIQYCTMFGSRQVTRREGREFSRGVGRSSVTSNKAVLWGRRALGSLSRPGPGCHWPHLRTLRRQTHRNASQASRTSPCATRLKFWADYRRYIRRFGAELDIKEFYELFWRRSSDSKIKVPKAMEAAFAEPKNEAEQRIKAAIDAFAAEQTVKLEQDLFKQRKRLADAERTLQTKTTKAASESKRIAADKIEWARGKAVRFAADGTRGPRFQNLPGALCAGDGHGERSARHQANALSMPTCRQAGFLRLEIPRHLQRTPRQSRGLLERTFRPIPRHLGRERVL